MRRKPPISKQRNSTLTPLGSTATILCRGFTLLPFTSDRFATFSRYLDCDTTIDISEY